MNRCKWCNLNNSKYIDYHDNEWGVPNFNDEYLFEMLILEIFQAGLSWETILNKREDFRYAFDDFSAEKISCYDEDKIQTLMANKKIIRNELKIRSSIVNASVFIDISHEFNGFYNYIKTFTNNKIIYENNKTKSSLSESISKNLKKRGMKFVGPTIIYSFLQAIGVIYSHEDECFLYKKNS